MSPHATPHFISSTLPPDDEPPVVAADAERVERWVGVSSTVVVLLAGMAALLV